MSEVRTGAVRCRLGIVDLVASDGSTHEAHTFLRDDRKEPMTTLGEG